jgi:hypothetical protein
MQFRRMAALFAVALAISVAALSQSLPQTAQRPVTDTYHGWPRAFRLRQRQDSGSSASHTAGRYTGKQHTLDTSDGTNERWRALTGAARTDLPLPC